MKKTPLVSIIVPVYNVEEYLPHCLDSLINQTYKNIEIICVNDETPDNSAAILEEYAERDNRVKVYEQKNMGLSGARNTGMRHASGEYVMCVDSDDWIDPETCEQALSAALKHNADLVMWSYVREFDDRSAEKLMFWDDGTVFDEAQVSTQINRRLCGLSGEELAHPDYANAIETAWGKLYRFSIIQEHHIEYVSERIIGTEDALFNLYATKYVKKAVYLKRPYNHYRRTNVSSLTSNYKPKLYSQWQKLFDYMEQYIADNGLDESFRLALKNRIALSILGLGLNITGADFSLKKKRALLKEIISSPRYREAYKTLEFKYFPIHWKLFYFCAKHSLVLGLYLLLLAIKRIIS